MGQPALHDDEMATRMVPLAHPRAPPTRRLPSPLLFPPLLLLLVLALSSVPLPATSTDPNPPSVDPLYYLNKLLAKVRIDVPDQKVDAGRHLGGDVMIDLTTLYCEGIHIGGIGVNHKSPPSRANLELDVNVVDTGVLCHLHVSVKWGSLPATSGTAKAVVAGSSLGARMTLSAEGAGGLASHPPTSASLDKCDVDVKVKSIDLTDGALASLAGWLVNLFKSSVTSLIEKDLNPVVCKLVGAQVKGPGAQLPALLRNVSTMLAPYLAGSGAPNTGDPVVAGRTELEAVGALPTARPDRLLALAANGAIRVASGVLNGVLGRPLVLPAELVASGATVLGGDGALPVNLMIEDFVRELGGNGSAGAAHITVPVNATIYSGVDVLTNTNLSIANITLTGLDTMSTFAVASPVEGTNLTLQHSIAARDLKALVRMRVSLSQGTNIKSGDGTIVEHFDVHLRLKDLVVNLSTVIAVDPSRLPRNMTVGTLTGANLTACLGPAIVGVNATVMTVSLGDVEASISNFIEPAMDHLLNNLTKTALALYEGTALRAMPGLAHQLARPMINNLIAGALAPMSDPAKVANAQCSSPTGQSVDPAKDASGQYVEFYGSAAMKWVNWALNDMMQPAVAVATVKATRRVDGKDADADADADASPQNANASTVVAGDTNPLSINRWIIAALDGIFGAGVDAGAADKDGRFVVPEFAGGPYRGPGASPSPPSSPASGAGEKPAVLVDVDMDLGAFGKVTARVADLTIFGLGAFGGGLSLFVPEVPATGIGGGGAAEAHTEELYENGLAKPAPVAGPQRGHRPSVPRCHGGREHGEAVVCQRLVRHVPRPRWACGGRCPRH